MDRIEIEGIRVNCRIGVSDQERSQPQLLKIDLILESDLSEAGRHDELNETIDYVEIVERVERLGAARSFKLIEALAESLANELLDMSGLSACEIRVSKFPAVLTDRVSQVAVRIRRNKKQQGDS